MSKSAKRKQHDLKKATQKRKLPKETYEFEQPFDGKPKKLPAIFLGFPAHVCGTIIPQWKDIPEEFRIHGNTKFHQFQSDWFYKGVINLQLTVKKGFDGDLVVKNLQAVNGSFEPKHEHKVAGFVYLCSLWLDDVSYVVRKD